MQIDETSIPDVKLLSPTRHADARGFFSETWNREALADAGIIADFVQDNHAQSRPVHTVRGLHWQVAPGEQGKLIRVSRGAIFDVAVDLRPQSPTFKHHASAMISEDNWHQIWIPPGFAHGYCTLAADTEVIYKVTAPWAPELERGLLWCDPDLAIAWPVDAASVVLSPRDQALPTWAEFMVSQ